MTESFDFWQFVGGIGLFLFAMAQLEIALARFSGRSFKRFLRNYTDTPLKAIFAGTATTAFVQSSSLVGLMVLAFVGAGIMSLGNALGVIFGANLGTTFTGWIVTTLGFKLDLEGASLPLIGIGSLVLVTLKGRGAEAGRLAVALGFLLMGLGFMKDSVGALAESLDVERLADLASWQYLLFGVAFAGIVQSSSAVMMVTLTALHANVIELPSAAAIAVGADLGTTSTILIGALKGAAGKKRVALAHVIFNVSTTVIAFAFLAPLLGIVRLIGVSDPLFSLVAFHSLFNFIGIVIFTPLLTPFAAFLGRRFTTATRHESVFVDETAAAVPDAAITAISEETGHIIGRIIRHNMRVFTPPLPVPPGHLPVHTPVLHDGDQERPFDELYRRNKMLEGEILGFAIKVQAEPLQPDQSERLNHLLAAVRQAVHSAKSLRDIRHNLDEFADSPRAEVNSYLDHFRSTMGAFYAELYRLRSAPDSQPIEQDYTALLARISDWHDQLHREIYADIHASKLDDYEISSLLNVNREVFNSNIALVGALQEYSAALAVPDARAGTAG